MLNTIREYIDNLPDIPFVEFYQQYVMQIQDECIDIELSRLRRLSAKDSKLITKMCNDTQKALVSNFGINQ